MAAAKMGLCNVVGDQLGKVDIRGTMIDIDLETSMSLRLKRKATID